MPKEKKLEKKKKANVIHQWAPAESESMHDFKEPDIRVNVRMHAYEQKSVQYSG